MICCIHDVTPKDRLAYQAIHLSSPEWQSRRLRREKSQKKFHREEIIIRENYCEHFPENIMDLAKCADRHPATSKSQQQRNSKKSSITANKSNRSLISKFFVQLRMRRQPTSEQFFVCTSIPANGTAGRNPLSASRILNFVWGCENVATYFPRESTKTSGMYTRT
jgi:hypothetical protein